MSEPLTTPGEGFHPHLHDAPGPDPDHPTVSLRGRLHHIRADALDGDTAQSGGMRRFAAVSGKTVGSEKLWMGQTHVAPSTASSDHHHGESETAIYVVSGHPEFVFIDDSGQSEGDGDGEEPKEVRLRTSPGDYIFVPPFVPHREENPDPDDEAVVVIARSTQEAIVVNLPQLYALSPDES
ncbi:cupin domain-containing protein [Streptomyces sp. LRE541]|uniref:cupin domain-containing protein n=1 Tax=Streptomyces sp. LRE541 TaxID=2931983 RepID=UPI00200FB2BC|nr:cupin domain-containing protein [Streptomyces sp. LRE541]UPZ27002.1 cupin domain-containing protein [Streptomyces sp. LRE541]